MKSIYKIFALMIAVLITIVTAGCGGGVNTVKNAFLDGKKQTTIGNAFEAAFDKPTWDLMEMENKTRYVEFKGITKKDMPLDGNGILLAPKGANIIFQFTLLDGGKFNVSCCEVGKMIVNPALGEIVGTVAKQQLDMAGGGDKPRTLPAEGIASFIDIIYMGN